ncbi:hypothetical protein J8281_03335 [Aquimarina sp. U1-2]|uniref:hypothetical protein n=1 Tax=Aquimarina sp. U1-2 TaxID=2823141 RepID=UPI001AECF2D2|nr:hypothetical protein [Aquimarina sp. U1-2]MBP2831210.1 hypothetical protein [Aquimarina sp. U1-2]
MKKVNLFLPSILLAITFLVSCSSDDSPSNPNNGGDPVGEELNPEDREIAATELQNKITIESGTFVAGKTPPAPTGTLDFKIEKAEQQALMTNGFNIEFKSASTDSLRAYIVLKDANGNTVDGYYDAAALSEDASAKSSISSKKRSKNSVILEDNRFFNVDFDESLQPGKFCYEICIYDQQGNISQIEEVCVQIEAWGGNKDIVGEWIFDREEPTDSNNRNTRSITCENGQQLNDIPYYKEERDIWTFVLTEDGIYYETYNQKGQDLDITASELNCAAIYGESYEDKDKYSGNWVYNEDEKTFTCLDFKYEDLLDPSNNEQYPQGSIYFDRVKIEVVNNELRITEIDGTDENGNLETYTYIFKKK